MRQKEKGHLPQDALNTNPNLMKNEPNYHTQSTLRRIEST
jgi:hypothetical protein